MHGSKSTYILKNYWFYLRKSLVLAANIKICMCGEGGVVQRSLQREKDSGDSGK